jgi:hypothetical protein
VPVALREKLGQELRGEIEPAPQIDVPPDKPAVHNPSMRITHNENGRRKLVPEAPVSAGHTNPPLREMNLEQMAYAAARREDAIKVINEKLIPLLKEEMNTQGPVERARNHREVQVQHFRDGTRKVLAVDGLRTRRETVWPIRDDKMRIRPASMN